MTLTQDKVFNIMKIGKEYLTEDIADILYPDIEGMELEYALINIRKKLRILSHKKYIEKRLLERFRYTRYIFKRVK